MMHTGGDYRITSSTCLVTTLDYSPTTFLPRPGRFCASIAQHSIPRRKRKEKRKRKKKKKRELGLQFGRPCIRLPVFPTRVWGVGFLLISLAFAKTIAQTTIIPNIHESSMEAAEINSSQKSPGTRDKAARRRSSADSRKGIARGSSGDTDINGRAGGGGGGEGVRRGGGEGGRGGEGRGREGGASESSGTPKLYHTLTACTRCRSVRKLCTISSLVL